MVKRKYIPNKGDLVILTFDPQAGHEQKGRRPALVVSNQKFNRAVGFALVCPITNRDRDFPFHVEVGGSQIGGFILTEQVKSIDYEARGMKFIEVLDEGRLDEVMGIIEAILR
ncbi:type II toxin-antitoxin system PemK/MazF family toxin [bacterium]|nr:type II toxin-antitoxin system PemK/MazF family toxin [bacterium]MBU1959400.1 type II toxin-antitoxin system PemK/MazF family toxin [bacterium]